ncbi:cytochrome c [soil metagenome]
MKRTLLIATCACLVAVALGCDDKKDNEMEVMTMRKQARYDTQTASTFFADGMTARPAVDHAVPVDASDDTRPPVTAALVQRGRQRYDIYCSMCHGTDGYGEGLVVQHGFPQPPSFHSDRLRNLPDDYLNHVITHGLGKMPPYDDQVPPADRWAIVSYVRALQRSQHATIADVPDDAKTQLQPNAANGGATR